MNSHFYKTCFYTPSIFTIILLIFRPSFFSKITCHFIKVLTYFHTKNVILSFVIFRMISKSQKKEEVYNILIINNLYINIYFFVSNFLEK